MENVWKSSSKNSPKKFSESFYENKEPWAKKVTMAVHVGVAINPIHDHLFSGAPNGSRV